MMRIVEPTGNRLNSVYKHVVIFDSQIENDIVDGSHPSNSIRQEPIARILSNCLWIVISENFFFMIVGY